MSLNSKQEMYEVKEKPMRKTHSIVSGTVLLAIMWGYAAAAPALPAADCQKFGGEVSALIDNKKASPNIAAARAAFQIGIMDCMEGDDAAANSRYSEAKRLLLTEEKAVPAAPVRTAAPSAPEVQAANCQKFGGEVSALIDTRKTSPNIAAARAAFQVGIMDCMEGDDIAANRNYQKAKELLADAR
jgi:hypothetical protein